MDLNSLFNEVKQSEVSNSQTKSYVSFDEDERFIQFKQGNTYTFRLLYSINPDSERKHPTITKYTHSAWDDNASTNKLTTATCPTSDYLLGNNGFKSCPICEQTQRLYKEAKAGSAIADEMYRQYRRKLHGYAMVYVINDPTNEDNNGKIKLIHFGITIHKWLKMKLYGIDEKGKMVDDEDVIGADAFELKDGYNLKVIVTQKDKYNAYSCEFSRKTSKVSVTDKAILDANKELKFDEEYYTLSEPEVLQGIVDNFILSDNVSDDSNDEELDLDDEEPETIDEAEGEEAADDSEIDDILNSI